MLQRFSGPSHYKYVLLLLLLLLLLLYLFFSTLTTLVLNLIPLKYRTNTKCEQKVRFDR